MLYQKRLWAMGVRPVSGERLQILKGAQKLMLSAYRITDFESEPYLFTSYHSSSFVPTTKGVQRVKHYIFLLVHLILRKLAFNAMCLQQIWKCCYHSPSRQIKFLRLTKSQSLILNSALALTSLLLISLFSNKRCGWHSDETLEFTSLSSEKLSR